MGLVFAVLALVISLFRPRERGQISRLALFYLLSLVCRVAREVFASPGVSGTTTVFDFLALLFQGVAFLGLAAVVVFAVGAKALRIEPPRILRDLTLAAAYVVLVFYLFSIHDVQLTGILATSAVVTAVIGFSLQETLANVMGGVALQLDESISPGDWVRFGDISGIVREINWRHFSIETRNGDTLIIPNSVLMKNQILIQGRRADDPEVKERRLVPFNVDYRFTPTTVIETVTRALGCEPIPHVAAAPAPSVILLDFKESWAVYQARYWLTDIFLDDSTDSIIRTRIFYALRRQGITPSIPAQTVFLTSENRERDKHVREKEHRARLKALEGVSILEALTADERGRLADDLTYAPFAPGEAMLVQGSAGDQLYILTKGEAEVRLSVEGAPARTVKRLEAPDVFGEIGMLTGEPRTATVLASSEVECWRLEKERFQDVLAARPKIAEEISQILAARDVELAAVREGLSEEAKRRRLEDAKRSLLSRIEDFFGIA